MVRLSMRVYLPGRGGLTSPTTVTLLLINGEYLGPLGPGDKWLLNPQGLVQTTRSGLGTTSNPQAVSQPD